MKAEVIAIQHVSLDGVFQGPARADEDTRGQFHAGGWAEARNDPLMQEKIGGFMAGGWSLLAGRVTYEGLYDAWAKQRPESPMTKALTAVNKYVVSHRTNLALPWEHSHHVGGDAIQGISTLKAQSDLPLVVFGSGVLVNSLLRHQLLDRLVLMIHPVVLGVGRHLFDRGTSAELALVEETRTPTGVLIAQYQPA
jgi:dihydrofolate reductase